VPLRKKEWTRIRAFGENVRRERLLRGLTQEQLAERCEIATRNLQKVEAGELNILVTTAFRIQLELRCPWKRLAPGE
jgi:transcriptional regulator with XRE-family HTH domain